MTVSSTSPIVRYAYQGPGDYTFDFRIFKDTDLLVLIIDEEGEQLALNLGVDYNVTTIEGIDGGTINVINPTASGGTLEIRRILPITQEVDWVNNDPLDAETLEDSFDRLVMILQQLTVTVVEGNPTTNWKGVWLPTTFYQVNDIITAPETSEKVGNLYACAIEHTSSTDFDTDLSAGFWKLALDVEYIEQLRDECEGFRDECEQYAQQAANSAQQAANSAADAALYRDQAQVSEANAAVSAQNAANCSQAASDSAAEAGGYANDAQLKAWEAEAERLTADSYATQDEDVAVDIYTSNGDGTFTATPTNPAEYSAFHWSKKASDVVTGVATITWTAPLENTGDSVDHIARIQPAKVAEWDAALQPGEESLLDVVAGDNITIDKTDPQNPIIASLGGGGGGGLEWQTEQSVDFLAESGKGYPLESGVTMQLPAAPIDNDQIGWKDFNNSFHTGEAFIDPNGNPIEQEGDGIMILNTRGQGGTLVWMTDRWLITDVTELNSGIVANKPLFHAQQQEPLGTAGGTSVVGDNLRALNTVLVNQISGAALAGGKVSLPAGEYYVEYDGNAYDASVGRYRAEIRTDADEVLLTGLNNRNLSGDSITIGVSGRFTLLVGTVVKAIQVHTVAETGTGMGTVLSAISPGPERHGDLKIWRLDTDIKKITVQDPQQYLKKPLFHFQQIEARSVHGGGTSIGRNEVPLNTVLTNEITGLAVSGSRFTIPPGEYTIRGRVPGHQGSANSNRLRLRRVSDDAIIMSGGNTRIGSGSINANMNSEINGRLTITQNTEVFLDLLCQVATGSYGLGYAYGGSTSETEEYYGEIMIWQEDAVVQAPRVFQPVNQPITGAYTTGNIFGGELEYIDASNVRVKPVSCMSDDLTTALAIDANTDVLISGIAADTIYNFFIVRYDTAAIGIEYDTDVNGANLPANVTHKRWLGFVRTGATNLIAFFVMDGNTVAFNNGALNFPDSTTTTFQQLDLASVIPTSRINKVTMGAYVNSSTTDERISINGVNAHHNFGTSPSATLGSMVPISNGLWRRSASGAVTTTPFIGLVELKR